MNEVRSAEQIEREISVIRAQIDHTLDAVQEKLSPGELLDQALTYVKDETGVFAGNFGRAVQNNPIPTALLGVSLAWLAFASRSTPPSRQPTRPIEGEWPERHGPSWRESAAERWHDTTDRVTETVDETSAKARSAFDAASVRTSETLARASHLREQAAQRLHDAGSRVREARERMYERWDTTRRDVIEGSTTAADFLRSNPLAMVGLGLAAGAVVAAMLPRTRREDELLGERRDELLRSAKDTVKALAEPVAEAATVATEQAVQQTAAAANNAVQHLDKPKPNEEDEEPVREPEPAPTPVEEPDSDDETDRERTAIDRWDNKIG